nr:hypothetical protein [Bacteroidales bacterium]
MKITVSSFMEKLDAAQLEINREKERLDSKARIVELSKNYIEYSQDKLREAYSEINSLRSDNEELSRLLEEERKQRAELEMKLAEMTKLLSSIAKKSSEEAMLKALQTFVNYSKRKTSDKRSYIKNTILEFANVNRVSLPEELANAIDGLDDEQAEPRNVTVNGNYNDIHDNGEVK